MIFTATRLADAFLIDVELHADDRGFLARTGTSCGQAILSRFPKTSFARYDNKRRGLAAAAAR
jgi:dTDP-4-dehydrorhamnose 3,5-epimerase-like enzyme